MSTHVTSNHFTVGAAYNRDARGHQQKLPGQFLDRTCVTSSRCGCSHLRPHFFSSTGLRRCSSGWAERSAVEPGESVLVDDVAGVHLAGDLPNDGQRLRAGRIDASSHR
jgi:hypothetical protein